VKVDTIVLGGPGLQAIVKEKRRWNQQQCDVMSSFFCGCNSAEFAAVDPARFAPEKWRANLGFLFDSFD
jgi:hypothetical protein